MKAFLIPLVALVALGVGATSVAADDAAPTRQGADAAQGPSHAESEAALKQRERACVRHTGTRITYRGRADHERCMAGRTYDQDDLRSTGETDVGQALRRLDPSIY